MGRGTAPLKSLITSYNQSFSFVIPLTHFAKGGKGPTGTLKGQAIIRGILEAPKVDKPVAAVTSVPQAAAAPEVAKPILVAAKPVEATIDVKNNYAPVTEAVKSSAPVLAPMNSLTPEKETPTKSPLGLSAVTSPEQFDDSKPLKLRLSRLAVRDLKDKGSAFDKQDPALKIRIGDHTPFETKRLAT